MKTQKCKQCKKNYNSLADGLCFHCNPEHWFKYFYKQYHPKDTK